MSTHDHTDTIPSPVSTAVAELPLFRTNLMRVGYLVMGVGLAVVEWPLLPHASSLPLFEGVVTCLLTALSLLALLGLRHPIRLLPVLLLESVWKIIWLSTVAVPAVLTGQVDTATGEVIFACSLVVIILAVIPWRYTWRTYVIARADRWR